MKTIYISGPITDNKTGQPREGWEKDFNEAEAMLRGMGFKVINPVAAAMKIELTWEEFSAYVRRTHRENGFRNWPSETPRWFYLKECILRLENGIISHFLDEPERALAGLYVIGDLTDISMSYGTMCEINFALSAGLPVWSQYFNGYQMTNMLFQKTDGITLAEAAKKLKGKPE